MRPFGSVTLEPRLKRGVPWGCDLFTFVTSAAGHMMRTLQKPQKSRPSKRQVNHRRFLHNMIQRKFADIAAANHRLASALFSAEDGDEVTFTHVEKPATPDQSSSPSGDVGLHEPAQGKVGNARIEVDGKSGPDLGLGSSETGLCEKKQSDSGLFGKRSPESQSSAGTITGDQHGRRPDRQAHRKGSGIHKWVDFISLSSPKHTDVHHSAEPFPPWCNSVETPPGADDNLSENNLYSWGESTRQKRDAQFRHDPNSHVRQTIQNVDTSAPSALYSEFSPLSLDSHDFSSCTQANKNINEMTEHQWMDMMELLEPEASERGFGGGCVDVETYLENVCAWQSDAGATADRACAHDLTFADRSEMMIHSDCDFRPETEHLDFDGGGYGYGHGYGTHGDQESAALYSADARRGSQCLLVGENEETEVDFASESFQGAGISADRLPDPVGYHHEIPDLNSHQRPRQESSCMLLNGETDRNCALFGSVAQSFPAPRENPQYPPIPTPPLENDWLFTDILQDQ